MGSMAVTFSVNRFRDQAWFDTKREAWPQRKKQRKKTKKRNRAILVSSGRLRRSIRVVTKGRNSVTIGSDVPYASIHNDGGRITDTVNVRAHTRAKNEMVTSTFTSLKTKKTRSRKNRQRTGTVQVQAHKRTLNTVMPQRRFIGNSAKLEQEITQELENQLSKLLSP